MATGSGRIVHSTRGGLVMLITPCRPTCLLVALMIAGGASAAIADEGTKVSCMRGGQVVYTDVIPADAPETRRTMIEAAHTDAFCVFVSPRSRDVVEDAYVATATGGNLADALAGILSGDQSMIGTRVEIDSPPAAAAFAPPAPSVSSSAGNTLGLVLAVYSDMEPETVLDHWRAVRRASSVLAAHTPTIATVDGVAMLAIEGVADSEAATICEAAERTGLGCLAAY